MRKTILGAFLAVGPTAGFGQTGTNLIEAPRFWNDHDLSDWATPIAGLNVRPAESRALARRLCALGLQWLQGDAPRRAGHEFGLKLNAEDKAALIAFSEDSAILLSESYLIPNTRTAFSW